ncbi:MAG: response regulator transcription factor [Propionibacteriaceae bacterium]|jgi:DNA-binding response OmpR family regulator|nr:response regulator transcription factor [Propionibacteriaceae bacterium]
MRRKKILVVEDNLEIQRANERMLQLSGYAVETAFDLGQARVAIKRAAPDLVVLDILLPDGSGVAFCEEIRRVTDVPILFVTALGETGDVVKGLRAGGDDYLPKPYHYAELMARIEALLRRERRVVAPTISVGSIEINLLSRRASVNGRDLLLTPKEFALLEILARSAGQYLSGAELYERAWGMGPIDDVRTVWDHMSRLRRKIGENAGVRFESARGKGYRITTGSGE